MEQIKNILTVFIIVFLFISLIINKKIREFICDKTLAFSINQKTINIKVKKITINLLAIFVIIAIIIVSIIMIVGNFKEYFEDKSELEFLVNMTKEEIQNENYFYKEIINKNYDIENCKNPYIPDGFTYVEGTWDTGFVVQDENENQFVWVPCTNMKNDENIEVLKKSNFSNMAFIHSFECNEENYKEFLISSLENGGFYVSRFEIGKTENDEPVSKFGTEIWTNITQDEAKVIANDMYENINSELINGYAYDTIFSWIINNEKIEITEKSSDEIYSGTKSYKNIYDIVDNIYEFTSEKTYGENVYRGILIDNGNFNDSNLNISNFGLDNRFSCDSTYESNTLGFRTILYK